MILIPLPLEQSRGDQIENAKLFHKLGIAKLIQQEQLTYKLLCENIQDLVKNQLRYKSNMERNQQPNANDKIISLILNHKLPY